VLEGDRRGVSPVGLHGGMILFGAIVMTIISLTRTNQTSRDFFVISVIFIWAISEAGSIEARAQELEKEVQEALDEHAEVHLEREDQRVQRQRDDKHEDKLRDDAFPEFLPDDCCVVGLQAQTIEEGNVLNDVGVDVEAVDLDHSVGFLLHHDNEEESKQHKTNVELQGMSVHDEGQERGHDELLEHVNQLKIPELNLVRDNEAPYTVDALLLSCRKGGFRV
jgi:hypothetical protein